MSFLTFVMGMQYEENCITHGHWILVFLNSLSQKCVRERERESVCVCVREWEIIG